MDYSKLSKAIINNYGYEFFKNKKILDVNPDKGELAATFYRLGADLTCVNTNSSILPDILKRYPGIKTNSITFDQSWLFTKCDLVLAIDFNSINFERDLNLLCQTANFIVLETAVADSDDPEFAKTLNNTVYLSQGHIEKILEQNNMSYKMVTKSLNTTDYFYDWISGNTGVASINNRRLWFIVKNDAHTIKTNNSNELVPETIVEKPRAPEISSEELSDIEEPTKKDIQEMKLPYNPKSVKNTPKIALCISGYLRTFEHAYDHLYRYLLSRVNCDVFIHTWNKIGSSNRDMDLKLANIDTSLFTNKLNSFYNPKKIVVENQGSFDSTQKMFDKAFGRDVQGVLSMFYKVEACNKLKSEYEEENNFKYDFVIRYRPDIVINDILDFTVKRDILYIPKFGDFGGLNDQFAYSSSEIMDTYSSLYSHIKEYVEEDDIMLNPEFLLNHHIHKNSIPVLRPKIHYYLKRANGMIQDNEFLERRMGFIR